MKSFVVCVELIIVAVVVIDLKVDLVTFKVRTWLLDTVLYIISVYPGHWYFSISFSTFFSLFMWHWKLPIFVEPVWISSGKDRASNKILGRN